MTLAQECKHEKDRYVALFDLFLELLLRSIVFLPSYPVVTMTASTSRDTSKSHPYFVHRVKLRSLHAQQVFDRGFEIYANAIFSLSVVLRIIGTDQQARDVEGVVDERMNKAFEDLRNEVARLEKLAEANGIEFAGIEYSRPKEVEAKITSPRAVRYLGLIREFDGMVARLDALWLSGVIPDSNYSRSLYEWKRRLLRLAGGIRSISTRAMTAARKKGAQLSENDVGGAVGEVEAKADTPEATMETVTDEKVAAKTVA